MNAHRASAWAALPDGITAAGFVLVWLSPFAVDFLSVRTCLLVMLVEFFLIHATGFFTAVGTSPKVPRVKRMAAMAGLTAFYLLMVGAFAWSFGEWWPLLALLWLAVGKAVWIWSARPDDGGAVTMAAMQTWAGSVLAYVGFVFLTIFLPIPRLGMTLALQPQFGLADGDNGGLWVEQPHRVVAFGVLYFGALSVGKLAAARSKRR